MNVLRVRKAISYMYSRMFYVLAFESQILLLLERFLCNNLRRELNIFLLNIL